MKQYTNFINGEWTSPTNNEFKDVENPTTEETIAQVAYSSNEDVDQAVEAAKKPSLLGINYPLRKEPVM